jgi:hypothetical protein
MSQGKRRKIVSLASVEWNGQERVFSDNVWKRLVPLQFHQMAGLNSYDFRTLPPASEYAGHWEQTGTVEVCVMVDGRAQLRTIAEREMSDVFQALILVGRVDDETVREQRYVCVYSAYECVGGNRIVDAAAVRHSLAHPPSRLKDQAIVGSLRRRFGGVKIDLRRYDHRKEFFLSLARLAMQIEDRIFHRLLGA